MDKKQRRKLHLVLYGLAIPFSLFGLYTVVFVSDSGTGRKIVLCIIGLGWFISGISGFINNLER